MPRLIHAIATAAAALALTATVTVPAVAAQRPAAPKGTAAYYLSLGDSLSVGDQPNAKGVTLPTDQGYADQLYAVLKRSDSNLRLAKLGCPGETTATLNKGGICGYKGDERISLTKPASSQLAAALAFLKAHAGHVPLITIDIGANDLNACIALGVISKIATCLTPVFKSIEKNLAVTLVALRAADPKATIVGMTYYVPELADWLTGKAGQQFAAASIILATQFNKLLTGVYKQAGGAPVADVFTAFDSTDMKHTVTLPKLGKLPKDVALICEWTYECAPKPVGPNEHCNKAGYAVIAATFVATLKKLHFKV
jgi:lysophospholipase L1-like esterase